MLSFWGRVFLTLTLFSFFSFGDDFEKICDEEIGKEDFNITIIQQKCNKTGDYYFSQSNYDSSSWFYLLGGEIEKNIKIVQKYIDKNNNLAIYANIAHCYILTNQFSDAKLLYRKYIEKRTQPNIDIQNDYKLLYKLYPQKKGLLDKGLKIWKELYQPLIEIDNLYSQYNHEEESEYYIKAIYTLERIINLRLNYFKKENILISTDYSNLSLIYEKTGDYDTALKYALLSFRIDKDILNEEHPDIAINYSNIGYIYEKLSKYKKAEKNYFYALKIFKTLYGEEDHTVATTYNNLAFLYNSMGNYKESLKLYKKSLKIDNRLLEDNTSIAITLSNIGEIYSILGENKKAMKYYQKSLAIDIESYGYNHTNIAHTFNNMAQIYELLEDYKRAEEYYKKALTIVKNKLKDNHPFLATLYANLGNLYYVMNEYKKSFKEHKKALQIRKHFSKENLTIDLSLSYHAIGLLYEANQDYNKSLEYFQKTLKINNQLLGKDNIANSVTYSSMGTVYKQMNLKEEALRFYLKAVTLEKKILGKNHRDLARSYNSLSLLYFSKKNNKLAYKYMKKAFNIFQYNKNKNFILLDNNQKINYTTHKNYYFNNFLYLSYLNESKKNYIFTINKWLNYKGTLFEYQNILSMLKSNPNSSEESKQNIRKLNKSNILLSKLSNQFPKNPTKIKVIEETIHQLEIQLSQNNNSFKNLLKLNDINSSQISSQLQENQLYIDFARGEDNYYIFTVDHNNTINFLQIDENDTNIVDLNIKAFHHNSKQMAKKIKENSLSISLKKTSKKEAQDILQQLHTTIIDKYLKKIIQSKNHLIISADGLLNFLPFEALYNHKSYFIEKYKISYVSSGKELLRQVSHGHKSKSSNVVVFGSPNFWFNLQTSSKTKSAITKDNATIFDIKFSTLESSKEEIGIMKKYYPNIEIYTDSNATIENLFTLKSPKILHISTHGFFLNNKNNPNPMLASGLAFAGANYANYKDDARGIATALQLTGLELQNTELVVLSACETALGKIHNAEGVTGLSKAFIQAGAKKVVMSLWKVSVQETITTMHYFYANIHAGNNYATALRQAKLHMITMHPYYWSAFIMSGI